MFQPYYNFQQPLYNTQSSYQNSYQQSVNLIRVTGYDGAKAYQMPPNSTTALFDSNDDLICISKPLTEQGFRQYAHLDLKS